MNVAERSRRIGRRGLFAGAAGLLGAAPAIVRAQGQGAGVALVIGNSQYRWETPLPNVRRDAPDVARCFQSFGLKTELLQDAGQDAMAAAIDRFRSLSSGASFAAFYFAGHGASWDQDTYLVPVDADLATPETVKRLLPVRGIGAAMSGAANRLLVFDNCRNNPADGWRQKAAVDSSFVANSQLSAAAAVQGGNALVLFSTAPGRVALDGPPDANSPFAASLLRQFDEASVDLSALSSAVRRDLLIATEGRQVAWDQNTYGGPFLLKRTARPPSGSQGRPVAPAANRTFDLPKAYAYAREKGLAFPPGIVACRTPDGSPDARKIGSFGLTMKMHVGMSGGGFNFEPALLVVMSAAGGKSAQVIFSIKEWSNLTGVVGGATWRFLPGAISGDRLTLTHGSQLRLEFTWRDANSGTLNIFPFNLSSPFTRLD